MLLFTIVLYLLILALIYLIRPELFENKGWNREVGLPYLVIICATIAFYIGILFKKFL
jgi:hypothetical protein